MKAMAALLAMLALSACDQRPAPQAPPPAPESKDSLELKLDTENGAVEFKKEDGGGDVDVEVKTE